MSQSLSGPCDRSRLHSARLLPCASSFSEEVVEGTHRVMAEGTGLEPYSPCQGLVRGQGGLEDVQACVDLAVHLPIAHQAHEHLAHPISAPSATHWAGLTGPRGIDFDDRHAFEGRLVLDLTMGLPPRPARKTPVHLPRSAPRAVKREVLEDYCGAILPCDFDQLFRHVVEPLADTIVLPQSLSAKQSSGESPVAGLPSGELSSSAEMCCLDETDAIQCNPQEDRRSPFSDNAVERILVRVEGDCTTRLKRERGVLPDHDDNLPWSDREDPSSRRVAQDRAVPIG